MTETCSIPSSKVKFDLPSGETFELEIFSFLCQITDIHKEYQQAGKDRREYCYAVIAKVAELCPGILLSLGEADWLIDQVGTLHAKKKQKQAEDTKKLLILAFSTDSGQADLPRRNGPV